MRLDLATFVTEPTGNPDVSEDDVVECLRTGPAGLSAGQAETVESMLVSTTSAKIRNAAALALLDMRSPRLEAAINTLLRRPTIARSAGTLLFCLMEADLRVAATAIPNIVRDGSYEARSELLILTSEGKVSFEHAAEMGALLADLAHIASTADAEAAEVAALAQEDIEALRER